MSILPAVVGLSLAVVAWWWGYVVGRGQADGWVLFPVVCLTVAFLASVWP